MDVLQFYIFLELKTYAFSWSWRSPVLNRSNSFMGYIWLWVWICLKNVWICPEIYKKCTFHILDTRDWLTSYLHSNIIISYNTSIIQYYTILIYCVILSLHFPDWSHMSCLEEFQTPTRTTPPSTGRPGPPPWSRSFWSATSIFTEMRSCGKKRWREYMGLS